MLKQIEVHGQRFELYTPDGGRTWASSPRSIVAFRRRQERVRAELRRRLEQLEEEIPGLDTDYLCHLEFPKHS
jgi:hypothetical protein